MPPPAAEPPVAAVAPIAVAPIAVAPIAVAPIAVAPVAVAPVELPPPMPPPAAPLVTTALPELLAVAHSALGFATAALAALPPPEALVQREPSAPEPPPGRAPRGDARSLRSDTQFALIYRSGATVVSRRGKLGEHGVWRTVAYPGPAQAAHAYALECSRLIEQGFRDVT